MAEIENNKELAFEKIKLELKDFMFKLLLLFPKKNSSENIQNEISNYLTNLEIYEEIAETSADEIERNIEFMKASKAIEDVNVRINDTLKKRTLNYLSKIDNLEKYKDILESSERFYISGVKKILNKEPDALTSEGDFLKIKNNRIKISATDFLRIKTILEGAKSVKNDLNESIYVLCSNVKLFNDYAKEKDETVLKFIDAVAAGASENYARSFAARTLEKPIEDIENLEFEDGKLKGTLYEFTGWKLERDYSSKMMEEMPQYKETQVII